MEHSPTHHVYLILLKLIVSHGSIILLCMITMHLKSAAALDRSTTFENETDRLALLDLKNRITEDPFNIMSSWNHSIHFCSWEGVTCHPYTKKVIILNLEAQKLVGTLPPSIGNLTHLTAIYLIENKFHGEIPQEIGRLRSLQTLNLTSNSFSGKIPSNMSHCTQLRVLHLGSNKLVGSIPNHLNSLSNLNRIRINNNNLTGTIPSWIGNFSSLEILYLGGNNFHGSIPNELGCLTVLERLSLIMNNLSGMIPSSLYNISSIYNFYVADNQLHGELPSNLGITLPNLQGFSGGSNKFTGKIPVSFANASKLMRLDIAENGLTGTVPAKSLGTLPSLFWLNFEANRLGSGKNGDLNFLSFLSNITRLEVLGLQDNHFGGELPASIANLSTQLTRLTFGQNFIHGNIPVGIGNLMNLTNLSLEQNHLSGRVPDEIGKLHKLDKLYLGEGNKFSGPIPSSLGNLTSLTGLFMSSNRFQGSIPPSLGNCKSLLALALSGNNLYGVIPKEITRVSSLSISLNMSNNYLTGSLPSEVGELVHLTQLDLSGNKLTGEIPNTLGKCVSLERLYLGGNKFEGTIPQTFKDLRGLEEMDISRNNLSGQIPEFIGKLVALKYLNLSYNDFEGELPKEGIFSNSSGFSIVGNHRLCGGIHQLLLPACPIKKHHSSSRGLLSPRVVIPLACSLAFIIALSCFIVARSMLRKSRGTPVTSRSLKDWKLGVSYSELVQSTNGFSVDNLIGSGSFGSVYKGVVPSDRTIVAVKVLNLQQQGACKSFSDECKALRSVRHRNLLKIITACSSIDNQGNDFKSLVFEYMKNGSVDSWLHRRDDEESPSKRLSLIQRLNIAIDVASALDYLHHHCETSIVHCDLKPSNVLLDEDMVAHVGDFGLAKLLLEAPNDPSQCQTISVGLKGSIGYIPPEYGMGSQASKLGDIYSNGILLLEMFTGKKPTDDLFTDAFSIHQLTATAYPDRVIEVVDPSLLPEIDDSNIVDDRYSNRIQERPITRDEDRGSVQARRLEECLVSVMEVGLSCSTTLPTERMLMEVVVNKMKTIRDSYLHI